MSIKSKVIKLEKEINICSDTPASLYKKFGAFPLIFNSADDAITKRAEYFANMAKELNITEAQAVKYYTRVYKKAGLIGTYPKIIDNV